MIFKPLKQRIIKIKWWFGFTGITQYPYIFILDPSNATWIAHENVHFNQQEKWYGYGWFFGTILFRIIYYLFLPIAWNPLRYSVEMDAYINGTGLNELSAREKIKKNYLLWLM